MEPSGIIQPQELPSADPSATISSITMPENTNDSARQVDPVSSTNSPVIEADASSTTPNLQPQKQHHQKQHQQHQPQPQETPVEQILRFWNHPALQHVSPSEKEEYLMTQKGITKEQIYQAWDQLLTEPTTSSTEANHPAASSSRIPSEPAQQPQQPQPSTFNGTYSQPPPYTSTPGIQQPPPPQQQQQQQDNASSYPATNPTTTGGIGTNPYNPPLAPHPSPTTPMMHQQQPPPYNNNMDEDEDQLFGVESQQVALIAAVGGFLGLCAAAAVRWLNGGDFQVFPPPSRDDVKGIGRVLTNLQPGGRHSHGHNQNQHQNQYPEDTTTVDEEDGDEEEEEEDSHVDGQEDDSDDDDGDDPALSQYLASAHLPTTAATLSSTDVLAQAMTQLAAFSETMQQHVSVQQRILQKLSSNNSPSVTDRSMEVLRQQQQQDTRQSTTADPGAATIQSAADPMLWYKLVEIQVELGSLRRTFLESNATATKEGRSTELEARLGQTLVRVEGVLKDMEEHLQPPSTTTEAKEHEAKEVVSQQSQPEEPCPESTTTAIKSDESTTNVDKDEQDTPSSETKESTDALTGNDNDTPAEAVTFAVGAAVSNEMTKEDDNDQHLRDLRQAVIDLVRLNADDPVALKAGTQVLFLYVSNLSKNPHLPRFRKVFTSNDSFQRVIRLQGGRELLCAIGFVPSEDSRFLEWPPVEMEKDGTTPKTLTTQEKEALVQKYHLAETASALSLLKSFSTKKNDESTKEAALELVERALEVLPVPPPLASPPQASAEGQTISTDSPKQEPEDDETDARCK